MLILRIRRAESALKDGRLDEAAELARAADVRAHARGQKLIGRLVQALSVRGRAHAEAGRLPEALGDCDKAIGLGGNLPDLVELRTVIVRTISQKQETVDQKRKLLHMARQHVENGQLSVVTALVENGGLGEQSAAPLTQEAESRRRAASDAVKRAHASMTRQDWAGAIDAVLEAERLHRSEAVTEVTAQVRGVVLGEVGQAIASGRLDVAGRLLERVRPIARESVRVHEYVSFLQDCDTAWQSIRRGEPRRAVEVLRKASGSHGDIQWLKEVTEIALRAAESLESLNAGPLAWLESRPMRTAPGEPESDSGHTVVIDSPRTSHETTPRVPATRSSEGSIPSKLLFHVDSVGSFLAVRTPIVRIGPAGSSRTLDVTLAADPTLPVITIERVEDDYFLSCEKPVQVNRVTVTRKLLAHGDQIALSPRCRIKFELPHPASTSATLTLSGTRLPRSDAKRIVLMDRAMVLGPGAGAHMRADSLSEPVILVVRDERLFCRTGQPVNVDERPMDRTTGLPLQARIKVGAVQFVMTTAA